MDDPLAVKATIISTIAIPCVPTRPSEFTCPYCQADPGASCRTGNRVLGVDTFHDSRKVALAGAREMYRRFMATMHAQTSN